jgi:hypothetical protein
VNERPRQAIFENAKPAIAATTTDSTTPPTVTNTEFMK